MAKNHARKNAARKVQAENPGMSFREAMQRTAQCRICTDTVKLVTFGGYSYCKSCLEQS